MKPISVGDLVMVVRTCCNFPIEEGVRIGLPWRVHVIANLAKSRCSSCGFIDSGHYAGSREIQRAGWNCAPLEWLKRLDPDALADDVPHKEELTV